MTWWILGHYGFVAFIVALTVCWLAVMIASPLERERLLIATTIGAVIGILFGTLFITFYWLIGSRPLGWWFLIDIATATLLWAVLVPVKYNLGYVLRKNHMA